VSRRDLVRLLPLLALYVAATFLFPERQDDQAGYLELAHRLTEGFYSTGDEDALLDADPSYPDLWFGPGLPLVLAPLVAADVPLELLRLVGPIALFGAMACFFALLRLRVQERPALVATYALGLYPPFLPLLPNLHSEPLAILGLAAGMLGAARYLEGGGRRRLALAAVGFAVLALTRVAYGWVLILVLLLLVSAYVLRGQAAVRRSMLVVVAALVLCIPWLVYTHSETGQTLVWGNSGALSLYWMASPYEGDLGDWRQADDVFSDPELRRHRPFFESLRGLPLAEQNGEIVQEALRNVVDHPRAYAGNVLANLGRLFANAPYSDRGTGPRILFYAVPNAILLAAVVAGIVALRRRAPPLPPEATLFLVLGGAAFAFHALLAAYPRMLTPIAPIAVWFAAVALGERRTT
jgi:hypothetical protein